MREAEDELESDQGEAWWNQPKPWLWGATAGPAFGEIPDDCSTPRNPEATEGKGSVEIGGSFAA
jgi:hypothetical protein